MIKRMRNSKIHKMNKIKVKMKESKVKSILDSKRVVNQIKLTSNLWLNKKLHL